MGMSKIQYLSTLTGSGKSEHIIEKIAESDEKFILVAPNRELCDELYTRLIFRDNTTACIENEAVVIHQKKSENPSSKLKEIIQKDDDIRVIITTQSAFLLMLNNPAKKLEKWNLVFDEDVPIYKEHEVNVTKHTHRIIHDTLTFYNQYDDNFSTVALKNTAFGINMGADIVKDSFLNNKVYKTLLGTILSDTYITLVSNESIDRFNNIDLDESAKKFFKFYAISLIKLEILEKFRSILFICSFFEKTLTYKLLRYMGAEMKQYAFVPESNRHLNTEHINIHYYFNTNWSTTLRSKKISNNKTVQELVFDIIKADIGGDEFLYNANVEFRNYISGGKLAVSSQGVNKYKEYTNLVYMPSLNANSATVKVLRKFGIDRKDIDFARNVLTAYQFASRGAIRNIDNDKEINIYVMDARTANFLKKVFTKARIQPMILDHLVDNSKKRPKIPNNIKSFMSRVRRKDREGRNIRSTTWDKYNEYLQKYYINKR